MSLTAVIDASVVLKLFFLETNSQKASILIESETGLLAPDILRVEVGSVFTKYVRRGLTGAAQCRKQCEEFLLMLDQSRIITLDLKDDFPNALMFSLQLNHALTDCLYLAMAQRLDVPLITADAVFYEKAKSVYSKMELL